MKKIVEFFMYVFVFSCNLSAMHESLSAQELNEIMSKSPDSVTTNFFDQFCPVSPKSKKDCPISPTDCLTPPLSPNTPEDKVLPIHKGGASLLTKQLHRACPFTPEFTQRKRCE